jgi:hypothetical protein
MLILPIVAGNLRLLIENIQKVCHFPLCSTAVRGSDADSKTVRCAHLHKVP